MLTVFLDVADDVSLQPHDISVFVSYEPGPILDGTTAAFCVVEMMFEFEVDSVSI